VFFSISCKQTYDLLPLQSAVTNCSTFIYLTDSTFVNAWSTSWLSWSVGVWRTKHQGI